MKLTFQPWQKVSSTTEDTSLDVKDIFLLGLRKNQDVNTRPCDQYKASGIFPSQQKKKKRRGWGTKDACSQSFGNISLCCILWRQTVSKDGPELAMCQGGGQSHCRRVNEVALALLKTAQRSWCYLGNPVWSELIMSGTCKDGGLRERPDDMMFPIYGCLQWLSQCMDCGGGAKNNLEL